MEKSENKRTRKGARSGKEEEREGSREPTRDREQVRWKIGESEQEQTDIVRMRGSKRKRERGEYGGSYRFGGESGVTRKSQCRCVGCYWPQGWFLVWRIFPLNQTSQTCYPLD